MQIRTLEEADYDLLVKWWKDWGWSPPNRDMLPHEGKGGLIVYDNEEPVCAGFLYLTNSKMAWVEFVISSKTYKKGRRQALLLLIAKLTAGAELSGAKYIYTILKHKGLIKTYESLGYEKADCNSQEMVKIL